MTQIDESLAVRLLDEAAQKHGRVGLGESPGLAATAAVRGSTLPTATSWTEAFV